MENEGTTHESIKYSGVKAMPYIIGNETFEKLGTIGTASNLLVYLTTVFGMKTITATNLVNVFNGSANFATLIGAFLSDTYYGRYNTLAFSSLSSFMGMVILTLTAAIHSLHPNKCSPSHHTSPPTSCPGPTTGQLAVLLTGLALLVVGAGGIRPCNLAFGADQFDQSTESGKRGTASFFNWYYFTFTFAIMVSMTLIVYVQSDVSWPLGLAIPALLMLISCVVFFVGTNVYVRLRPQGSPLVSVAQVIVAAFRKRRFKLAQDMSMDALLDHVSDEFVDSKIPYTDQFRFLDKGAIITEEDQVKEDGSSSNPWRLITLHQSEEVKCILRVLPIWVSAILYSTSQITLQNYVVFQALQSNRHVTPTFQIPAASYSFFTMLAVTLWLPFYDRLAVPLLNRLTSIHTGITLLQKIGTGIFISIIAMGLSSYVESKRRLGFSSQSGFWLVPQLALAGVSEAFAMVGLVEFYYKEVSDRMRSFGGSLFFTGVAASSYLSSLIELVVDRVSGEGGKGVSWLDQDLNVGRLDLFYGIIAGLEVVNLVYFLVCAKWYRYKGTCVSVDKEMVELPKF